MLSVYHVVLTDKMYHVQVRIDVIYLKYGY